MSQIPSISDAEWEVMNVLWSTAPLTANDVVAQLQDKKSWSPKTIKTLLNRLVKKSALAFEVDGNRYSYRPAIKRDQCIRAESRSFLDRVFGGAAGAMLVHFVSQAKLTPKEIGELKKLLAEKSGADRNNHEE